MTRIKVCGITREEDAVLAAKLGVWAVGFVFWPDSPRSIDPARARRIISRLPPSIEAVGVFVDQPAEWVADVAREAKLTLVQLHGQETPDDARRMPVPVIKAMTLHDEDAVDRWSPDVTLLVDAHDPVRRGGTGMTIDWHRAARIARRRPILLSGGLRPDNVGDALRIVSPAGVDTSSGVEAAPGVKDHERMRAFAAAVGRAEVTS